MPRLYLRLSQTCIVVEAALASRVLPSRGPLRSSLASSPAEPAAGDGATQTCPLAERCSTLTTTPLSRWRLGCVCVGGGVREAAGCRLLRAEQRVRLGLPYAGLLGGVVVHATNVGNAHFPRPSIESGSYLHRHLTEWAA